MIRSLLVIMTCGCASTLPTERIVADHLFFCAHYLQRGLLDQAEARCELALEHDPNSAQAYNLLGLVERARGDLTGAKRHFKQAIAIDDELVEALNNFGEVFVERREWSDARDLFAQALEVDPSYLLARANFAKALYYTGDAERAAKEYLKCSEQSADHCECRLGLGVIAVERGDAEAAIAQFEKLARICPAGSMGLYNLCWAYLAVDRCRDAARACGRALEIDADHLEAKEGMDRAAQCVAQQEAALEMLEARVKAQPDDSEQRFALGCRYEEHERYRDALISFQQVLALAPDHLRAQFRAARTADRLLLADDTVAACRVFLARARGESFATERVWCASRVRELAP